MANPKEILEAYLTKFFATDNQKHLAEQRINICMGCENKKYEGKGKLGFWRCVKCGCVLSGKVFTRVENACPLGKWSVIDRDYFNLRSKEAKKSKKLI